MKRFLQGIFRSRLGDGTDVRHRTLSLYHGDTKVGEGKLKTQLGAYAVAGAGLFVGRHGGEPITDDYPGEPPYTFTAGAINRIAVDVSGEPYLDLERRAEMLIRSQ